MAAAAIGGLASRLPAQQSVSGGLPFVVTDTSVRQGRFEAVAVSRDTILSSYPRAAREIRFRFSLNGAENEFPSGTERTVYLRPHDGRFVTPVYHFGVVGTPPPPTPEASATSENGTAQVTFRLDLRNVLRSLRERGYYDPPLGDRIVRGGLAHVYVVGEPAPLSWDYGALRPGSPVELTDPDSDGIYEATVPIATQYTRPLAPDGCARWARTLDLSGFPTLRSSQRIQDAVYRLSLEELRQLVLPDGTLSAGAKWPGVWTRDVSLSALLSLAIVAPDAARRSLLAKVDSSGRIIQDTGTGGSWPISSDRMVWALAAWEVYASTGDRTWLRQAYGIIRRSAQADLHAVRDPATGLFDGESSFMDWRSQSYPRWMQPADIYQSQNLGTNAVHYAAYRVLATMARALGESSAGWDSVATGIRGGMGRHLWQPQRGWFAEYRYGHVYRSLSPRAEGLGEALAVITGAASPAQSRMLLQSAPVVAFGTPTFWPYIPGERFYHNGTVWPFVTAYWTWAAADAGNTTAVERGLDDATREVALFLTNKENMVASTGHFEGTALNSDRQLWSVAGTLAGTFRVLFGMRFHPDGLEFRPMVPASYAGVRTLSGVHYRGATLTVTVRGYGDAVASVRVDGRPVARAMIPAGLAGAHAVDITMNDRWPGTHVNVVPSRFAPATPEVTPRFGALVWRPITGAVRYVVYRDGRPLRTTRDTTSAVRFSDALDEYQVLAVNGVGDESFLSEPVSVVPASAEQVLKVPAANLEPATDTSRGFGVARLTTTQNTSITVPFRVQRDGEYAVDVRYANGSGPINTGNSAAVRTLLVDGDTAGVLVMPQRGDGRWTEWGWSNPLLLRLRAGAHTLRLEYTRYDRNMNGRVNTALVQGFRLRRVATDPGARAIAQRYQPARDLGRLFSDVQMAGLFSDSKTFADARPLRSPAAIRTSYASERAGPSFSLRAFVAANFALPDSGAVAVHSDTAQSMEAHIRGLWPLLTRPADTTDTSSDRSSLIPLPHPYVVPGGRFREGYYWDSYFTMLGLVRSGRLDLVKDMLDNFAYLVRTVGYIPNGNRTYYLGRSQPPYFAAMVGLYARATDTAQALPYLDALEAEHAFWMDGADRLRPGEAYRRVVRLPDGALLNRYWDDVAVPRPESYRPDATLGRTLPPGARERFYRNVSATAESGWDFSSRWMRDPRDLRTLETTALAPVDLNALLYHAERTIAALRRARNRPGDDAVAARYDAMAAARRHALLAAMWDPTAGWFFDVRWRDGTRVVDRPTLAAASALYFGVATADQARQVAARLGRDFLKPGGFVTTLIASGQQWDAPNGWPPLQWLAIEGLRRYGHTSLADRARARWLALNRRVYHATGKMTEKYDVVHPTRGAGGGEYPTQDGFGWTNGVALALADQARGVVAPHAAPSRPAVTLQRLRAPVVSAVSANR